MFTKRSIFRSCVLFLAVLLMSGSAAARPLAAVLGTGFTYQGRLTNAGVPANGTYDFQFKLYDALADGTQAGATLPKAGVTVTNGLFTVLLDFGNVFDGTALFLEIGVRPGGSAVKYTLLTPRQPLTATPNALHAMQSSNANQLAGQPGSYYLDASNINAGSLGNNFFDAYANLGATGYLGNAENDLALNNGSLQATLNADQLDGAHAGNSAGNVPLNNGTLNKELNADLLDGLDASAFVLAPQNVVVVAKNGGNYTTITDALNHITDASDTNCYLIYVAPGEYSEQVTMKPYVDIQGAGELTTKITWTGNSSSDGFSSTLLGADNAELRFLTVENTGSAAYAIAIYNSSASPRLTHITATVSGGFSQSIGVFNSASSSPTMTDVTAIATGTGGWSFSVALQNVDSSSPTMTNSIATAAGGEYNYGVNNLNSSSPTMTNSIASASGGSYNYGVANQTSSSPIMTNVTITVSGKTTNRGVLNQYSSSPVMTNVTVSASGESDNFGILNSHASAPTITNCSISASSGARNFGIYNDDSETATIRVNNSQISGSTSTITNSTNVTMLVGASQLSGGPVDISMGGTLTCAGVYDEDYIFYTSTCP
jgi:hypothetical protein